MSKASSGPWPVVVLVAVLVTAGCTALAPERSADRRSRPGADHVVSGRPGVPGLPTKASTGLPEYEGPPGDAPASLGPLTTLRAAVDLTPATPGVFARTVAVAAAADGGAFAVLDPIDRELPAQLVTVGPDLRVTRTVPIPSVLELWGMHELADGRVVIGGLLSTAKGYGIVVVDPVTGRSASTAAAPFVPSTINGGAALSGDTMFLFIGGAGRYGTDEQLVAIDARRGLLVARRDLTRDVAAASLAPIGRQFGGLLARPGGGVTMVFDASPTEAFDDRIPTLLSYDATLTLTAPPVRVTDLSEGAETQAAAVTPEGTVFLLVEVSGGDWLLAVPDGGGAGPVLAQLADRVFDYALAVEPAQRWALVPSATGVRAVDLGSGELGGILALGCEPRLDVYDVVPAVGGAVLSGECDTPREDTQMLWFAGP